MDQSLCLIGDEDFVCGFLLAGVGQRDARGNNFLVVDAKTSAAAVEAAFKSFAARADTGLLLISAPIADTIRSAITAHASAHRIPMVRGGKVGGSTAELCSAACVRVQGRRARVQRAHCRYATRWVGLQRRYVRAQGAAIFRAVLQRLVRACALRGVQQRRPV